jgi:predicted RND superfamily exporter protein
VDLIERTNRLVHGDDPAFERMASVDGANAELLELVALQDPNLLQSWVSLDRRTIRISVDAENQSYRDRERGMAAVEGLAAELLPGDWRVAYLGEVATGIAWVRDVQATQLRSFPTAFALVFVMLALFLRSFWLALAGMVPTLLAVVVTLGAMGWLGMSLDVGRAMIAAVVIGIAVDDAIHLLHAYRQRRLAGEAPGEAMEGALLHVGRAVVTTSIALALGFLTLMASAWQTIASFGFLMALALLGALAATLFVLPALIFAFARDHAGSRNPLA